MLFILPCSFFSKCTRTPTTALCVHNLQHVSTALHSHHQGVNLDNKQLVVRYRMVITQIMRFLLFYMLIKS
jgi:hypothetical protein